MNRLKTAALLASPLVVLYGLASPGAALAQGMGNEVTVNPVTPNGGMLLYPGGQYMRLVPPLEEPGQTAKDNAPIRLHMPGKRPAVTAEARPVRRAPKVAAASPPPAEASSGGFSNLFPGASTDLPAPPPAKPAPTPRQEAAKAPAKPKPTQMAKAEPAPPAATAPAAAPEPVFPGLTKRSMIQFTAQQTDPAQSALGAIKFLAADLNSAMTGPGSRIELIAYGGPRGDKSSDSHRLALKRALAIRQVLIDDGVPAERIDVQAPGGVEDSGPADRVDVYIKA